MISDANAAHALLERRARALAVPLAAHVTVQGDADGALSLLVIRLSDERIAIALDHIIEVHRPSRLSPIPGALAPVVGVVAWRGRVLTVLDVAHGRSGAVVVGDATRILVMGDRRASFGIVADEVEDVLQLHAHQIGPVDDVAPARRDIVRGVTSDALIVLDAAGLVARFATPN